jgi:hypothetical protein
MASEEVANIGPALLRWMSVPQNTGFSQKSHLLTPSLISGEESSSVHEKQDWFFSFFAEWKEHIETIPLRGSVPLISDDTDILRRLFIEWLEEYSPFLITRDQLPVRKEIYFHSPPRRRG